MCELMSASRKPSCAPSWNKRTKRSWNAACAPSTKRRHLQDMPTFSWTDTLKQLGISGLLAVILIFYYQGENAKWEARREDDRKQWQQLFDRYVQDQQAALHTIQSCCRERHAYQEGLEDRQ